MTDTPACTESSFNHLALLKLLQLVSPALPIGAFAYSQGFETAVESAWVNDEFTAETWIQGILTDSIARLDLPILARIYNAWLVGDLELVNYWNRYLLASRESKELFNEDVQVGAALQRLLNSLDVEAEVINQPSLCCGFALAAQSWHIPLRETAYGYCWSWVENQVAAATKLVPLGQTSAQRILSRIDQSIIAAVELGLSMADEDIGSNLPGLAIASALHESQYSRLFRS